MLLSFDKFEWIHSLGMDVSVYTFYWSFQSLDDIGFITLSAHFWVRHIIAPIIYVMGKEISLPFTQYGATNSKVE